MCWWAMASTGTGRGRMSWRSPVSGSKKLMTRSGLVSSTNGAQPGDTVAIDGKPGAG